MSRSRTALIRGAVLEGCSAAGKTSVLRAAKRRQAERGPERSVVVIAEHYSQALQRVDGGYSELSMEEHRRLLSERLVPLESLQAWAARTSAVSREAAGVFFLLERFHLNHRASYPSDVDWSGQIETRLNELNAVCFLLTVSEPFLAERLEARLSREGAAADRRRIESEAARLLEQQETLVRIARATSVATVLLRTDDQDWDRCADRVLDPAGAI